MDHSSPRYSEAGTPRFTEHINSSPPYSQYVPGFRPESPPAPTYRTVSEPDGDTHYSSLLSKDRPMSPELINGGLEAVRAPPEEDKEVAYPDPRLQPDQYLHRRRAYGRHERSKRRICGLSALAFSLLLAAILVIALGVGLGVGLGLGLRSRGFSNSQSNADTEYKIGGAVDPAYYSTIGAFNGSGIALASQSFATNLSDGTQGSSVIYFQHHTGSIRWVQLNTAGQWVGGSESEIVASNAKNGTPLSAVSHSLNGTSTWHIFYIDEDNLIRQRSESNTSLIWKDGPINALNLKAFDADQVGLQACWYGSDYGNPDYKHSPLPGPNNGDIAPGEQGIWMWYASDNSTFQQYGWRPGDKSWAYQETWHDKNGHAGVGCYTWDSYGSVRYAMFVNPQDSIEVYWRDSNTNLTNTTTHPINTWTKSNVSINNVNPATSLGYTNVFYAQDATTNLFHGYNISWAAENTTIVGDNFTVGSTSGISGSHLTVSTLPNPSGGNSLVTFYQTNGSDITEFTRDAVAGQWTSFTLSIPAQ